MLDAVCAGHVCLDLVPTFLSQPPQLSDIFVPGKLTDIGALQIAAGGSIVNTGVALSKFGMKTTVMALIGDDELGALTSETLMKEGMSGDYLTVRKGASTSYSIVLSVPGYDRMFLENQGTNYEFGPEDIDWEVVKDTRLFHIGYISHLQRLYENDGELLEEILKKAKDCGATTSLDTAMPDLASDAARCDWQRIFARCMPYVDIFCPSVEELLYMTDPCEYWRLHDMDWDILHNLSIDVISAMASRMVGMGAKIVYVKCGYLGQYLKTAPATEMHDGGRGFPENIEEWASKDIFSAPFRVREVRSTIGAGGVAIAGLLCGILSGETPEESLQLACAAAAYCVKSLSAVGDLATVEKMKSKIDGGWEKLSINYLGPLFSYDPDKRLYTA